MSGSFPVFAVKKVVKTFPSPSPGMSEVRAVDGVSLEIREGECLLIAGANGSGKTLLMRMISGLLDPTSGEILFRGKPLGAAEKELRRAVGLVFQDPDAQFVGETVAEDIAFGPKNLGLPKAEVQRRVETALTGLGLTGKRDSPPRWLSGGEKRRLAVAGILAMGGEIIIMDEPFVNLDWPGVVQVLEIITALKSSGKTMIILTHELEKILALADRLIILVRGTIRDAGPPEEVLDRLKSEYGVRDPRKNYASARDCTWL